MKKLVNANLQSFEEFLKRMIDGERFYFGSDEYFYIPEIGFRFAQHGEVYTVYTVWVSRLSKVQLDRLMVEVPWYENIPEGGVLCWVSDFDSADKTFSAVIFSYCSSRKLFRTIGGTKWKYATPVKPEECFQEDSND